MITLDEHPILGAYYATLLGGADSYEPAALLEILGHDFVFDGPIAGRMEGGVRFTHGVRGFIETVSRVTVLQAVISETGAAVLYDAELPAGTVRFSEFFEFAGDRIQELRIQYNAAEYIAAGGR